MKITLAVLADYANVSQEGKLNIMGVFDRILAPSVPISHPEMRLVLRMEVEQAELGRDQSIEIQCMDEDGDDLLRIEASVTVSKETDSLIFNNILDMKGLTFNKFGGYTFSVFVNNDLKKQISFDVVDSGNRQPTLPGTEVE